MDSWMIDYPEHAGEESEIEYSHPRKYDNNMARSHEEVGAGRFDPEEAAEEGLVSRERMSLGGMR